MSKSSVLIVEDNAVFRKTLKSILMAKYPNVDVMEAENATQTMDKIRTECPDLIFMDINLRLGNGLQLTEKIKSLFPDVLIFIITNYDSTEYRDAAEQSGADGFFSKKSSSLSDLVKVVESIPSAKGSR
jgi:DNA-binding NarL/FixJ family response regulator